MDNCDNRDRPVMSSKACAFSIAALVGDDVNDDDKSECVSDDLESHSNACISPIGKSLCIFLLHVICNKSCTANI